MLKIGPALNEVRTWIIGEPQPEELYFEAKALFSKRFALVLWVMAVPLVLLFGLCDLFFMPEKAPDFLKARLLVIPVALISHVLFYVRPIPKIRYTFPLFFLTAYLSGYNCYLIYCSGNEASAYYAGLNLVILGSLGFLPLSVEDLLIQISLAFIPYASLLAFLAPSPLDLSKLVPNLFFMIGTAFLGIIAHIEFRNLRLVEFTSRNELAKALSAMKAMQADLFQSEKMAALGTVAAILAHEVNNTMQYTSSSAQTAQLISENLPSGKDKDKLLKCINMIAEGAKITSEVVANISAYSGINVKPQEEFEVGEIVDSAMHLAAMKLLQSEGTSIETKVEVTAGIRVFGSIPGFYQIILNLVYNAIDAMPNGGILTVVGTKVDEMVQIRVSDTGVGISSDNLKRVFDPLFTTKIGTGGSGLGLHVVKVEVEKIRGTINVRSEVNSGTEFTILIPLAGKIQGRVA